MWGSFGDITFQLLKTPESIQVEDKNKFAKISIFGRKEKNHFIGSESRKINLSFFFSSNFCNPKEEIEKLNVYKEKLIAENLIIGNENYGKFTIESLQTQILHTLPNGKILTARVNVLLTEV